jgi:hypothetical protein
LETENYQRRIFPLHQEVIAVVTVERHMEGKLSMRSIQEERVPSMTNLQEVNTAEIAVVEGGFWYCGPFVHIMLAIMSKKD